MRQSNADYLRFHEGQKINSYKVYNDGHCFYFECNGFKFAISPNQASYLNCELPYCNLTETEASGVENALIAIRNV